MPSEFGGYWHERLRVEIPAPSHGILQSDHGDQLENVTERSTCSTCNIQYILLRVYIFQKLLLAWNFPCVNKNCFFYQGDGYLWPHCCVNNIDHFTPQHTAFGQSAAFLSVVLALLPGLIPFAILWHVGSTLEKTICMNTNYNYLTKIFRSFLTQIYCFSGIIYIFLFWNWIVYKQKLKKYIFFLPEICTFGRKYRCKYFQRSPKVSKYLQEVRYFFIKKNGNFNWYVRKVKTFYMSRWNLKICLRSQNVFMTRWTLIYLYVSV